MHREEHVSLLDFRRGVATELISKGSQPSKTKSLSNKQGSRRSPSRSLRTSPLTLYKRRKFNYSVPNKVRLDKREDHWPLFTPERRQCVQCSLLAVESRLQSKCSLCRAYHCVSKKIIKICSKDHNIF